MPDCATSCDDVLVERRDRQRVLEAGVAIDNLRQVQLEVEPAFERRHQLLLLRGHDDPLPLLAVARHVQLDRLRVPVLAVTPQDVLRVLEALDVVAANTPGPVPRHARPEHLPGLDQVAIREDVGRRRLRIARRRHAVGEVGEVLPDLRLVHVPRRPDVRVHVDETRHDGLAGHVDDLSRRPAHST